MAKYNVYPGKFVCHTCGAEVQTLRSYPLEKRLTWMCSDKHVSEISLSTKKSKKDYE
jgi:transposase-like protein